MSTPRETKPKRSPKTASTSDLSASLTLVPAIRREGGREVPLGGRGAATRAKLLIAARHVFETQGYVGSSVAQISEQAGVSQGTYYQYFQDRSDVMAALVAEHVTDLIGNSERTWRIREGRAGLGRMMLAYVTDYSERAPFFRVWEEVSQIDPNLADVRRHWTHLMESSIEMELKKGQQDGSVETLGSPKLMARALTSMADRFCFLSFVFDPTTPPISPQAGAHVLTHMWATALGLPD